MSFVVENIDYAMLTGNMKLYSRFSSVMQATIAQNAELPLDKVIVSVDEGSVIVNAVLIPLQGMTQEDITGTLTKSSGLVANFVGVVKGIEGIKTASTGAIGVSTLRVTRIGGITRQRHWGQEPTCDGTGMNLPCMFPFTFKDMIFDSCTMANAGKYWCSVDQEGHWGYCDCLADDKVKRHEGVIPFTPTNPLLVGKGAVDIEGGKGGAHRRSKTCSDMPKGAIVTESGTFAKNGSLDFIPVERDVVLDNAGIFCPHFDEMLDLKTGFCGDTGGTCKWLGCDASRNAKCVDGKCICGAGQCSMNGVCKDSPSAQLTNNVLRLAADGKYYTFDEWRIKYLQSRGDDTVTDDEISLAWATSPNLGDFEGLSIMERKKKELKAFFKWVMEGFVFYTKKAKKTNPVDAAKAAALEAKERGENLQEQSEAAYKAALDVAEEAGKGPAEAAKIAKQATETGMELATILFDEAAQHTANYIDMFFAWINKTYESRNWTKDISREVSKANRTGSSWYDKITGHAEKLNKTAWELPAELKRKAAKKAKELERKLQVHHAMNTVQNHVDKAEDYMRKKHDEARDQIEKIGEFGGSIDIPDFNMGDLNLPNWGKGSSSDATAATSNTPKTKSSSQGGWSSSIGLDWFSDWSSPSPWTVNKTLSWLIAFFMVVLPLVVLFATTYAASFDKDA